MASSFWLVSCRSSPPTSSRVIGRSARSRPCATRQHRPARAPVGRSRRHPCCRPRARRRRAAADRRHRSRGPEGLPRRRAPRRPKRPHRESVPELASTEPDPVDATMADRRSMAFAGTAVVGGRGEGIVVATGGATELGRISRAWPTRSDVARRSSASSTDSCGSSSSSPAASSSSPSASASCRAIRGRQPPGRDLRGDRRDPGRAPVLLAVILGLGSYRLLKRGVLVRRLSAEETLGAVDLIITDKTGTLTENRLALRDVLSRSGRSTPPNAERRSPRAARGGRRLAPRDRDPAQLLHACAAGCG